MFSSSTGCLFRVIRSGSGSLNEGNLFLSKTSSWEEQVIDVLIAKSSYTLVTRSSNKLIESFHLWWFRLQCKYPMLFHHFLLFAFPLYLMMRSEVELSGWATRGSRKKIESRRLPGFHCKSNVRAKLTLPLEKYPSIPGTLSTFSSSRNGSRKALTASFDLKQINDDCFMLLTASFSRGDKSELGTAWILHRAMNFV